MTTETTDLTLQWKCQIVATNAEGDRLTARWQFPEKSAPDLARRLVRFYPGYWLTSFKWSEVE